MPVGPLSFHPPRFTHSEALLLSKFLALIVFNIGTTRLTLPLASLLLLLLLLPLTLISIVLLALLLTVLFTYLLVTPMVSLLLSLFVLDNTSRKVNALETLFFPQQLNWHSSRSVDSHLIVLRKLFSFGDEKIAEFRQTFLLPFSSLRSFRGPILSFFFATMSRFRAPTAKEVAKVLSISPGQWRHSSQCLASCGFSGELLTSRNLSIFTGDLDPPSIFLPFYFPCDRVIGIL